MKVQHSKKERTASAKGSTIPSARRASKTSPASAQAKNTVANRSTAQKNVSVKATSKANTRDEIESERRLGLILEATEHGYWDWDLETGSVFYGPGWISSLEYSEEDFSRDASFWESIIHPDDLPEFNSRLQQHLSGKTPRFEVECRLRTKSGSFRWIRHLGRVVERSKRGNPIRFVGTSVDIHDRKRAQERLARSEAQLSALFENTKDFIFSVDCETFGLTSFNRAFKDYCSKYLHAELAPGMTPSDLLPPDRAVTFSDLFERALHEGHLTTDYEVPAAGMVLQLSLQPLVRENAIFGISVFGHDISNRKRMESALRKSEEKFARAFLESPMVLAITSIDQHTYLEVNEAFEQFSGYSREEVIGRTPFDLNLFVDPSQRYELARRVREEGRLRNIELKYRNKGGEIRDGLAAAEAIEIDGQPCMLAVIADITDRKRAEQALIDSEERLRLAIGSGRMYAFEWNLKTDAVSRSEESFDILGIPKEDREYRKQELIDSTYAEDRVGYLREINTLSPANPTYRNTYRVKRPDGKTIYLEESGRAFFDAEGKPTRIVGMVADVTDKKLAELALRELSGHLITSQEEERRRIARELHDGIGQELALTTIRAQRLDSGTSESVGSVQTDVHDLYKGLRDVAGKISDLSHRLHSSELDLLGLAVASDRLCREFAKTYSIDVDHVIRSVPQTLSQDISLCFYRVTQEALQNVAKHSKAHHVVVHLIGSRNELFLKVSDDGIGFDMTAPPSSSSLGLISIRERMRLVGGTASVNSTPGQGTTVVARLEYAGEEKD